MHRLLAVAMIAMPLAAFAQQPGIQVDHVWSRAAPAGHDGAVYLTITDTGPPDTLTGVTTPVAAMAGLHETINDDGVMKMRPVASLPVGPGKPVTLAPGGYHIMLMDLKQPLKEGDSFPVTLSFAKAGQVTATATVAKAGAAAMPGMDHGSMGGMGNMPMQGGGKQP
jgi:copper(I)-binding protein